MKDAEIDHEIITYRQRLIGYADLIANDDRAGLYAAARAGADALTCLLDEAPPEKKAKISYLLDRYEALLASIAN